jgi:hypothetical protein
MLISLNEATYSCSIDKQATSLLDKKVYRFIAGPMYRKVFKTFPYLLELDPKEH